MLPSPTLPGNPLMLISKKPIRYVAGCFEVLQEEIGFVCLFQ
jgi:hypothetical protein